jgi:hypothetical protein
MVEVRADDVPGTWTTRPLSIKDGLTQNRNNATLLKERRHHAPESAIA